MAPIHWAATKGDLWMLRKLVEVDGVDPSERDTSSHHCETPLFRAAGGNHTDIIEYLVDHAHCDVNQTDDSNHTPLSWTCYFDANLESVELLLRKGADPDIATHDGRTPLMIAAYAGYSDIVRALLRDGRSDLEATPGDENPYHKGCTPLLLAAEAKKWETVGVLLEAGADPTARTGQGQSVLEIAKANGAPRRLIHRIENTIGDAERVELLFKARAVSDASRMLSKAVLETYGRPRSNSQLSSLHERHARCLAAAPAFLKARVADGTNLPTATVWQGIERPWDGVLLEERAKAVASYVIAPAVSAADAGEGGGLHADAFAHLMALMIPRFVRLRAEGRVGRPRRLSGAEAARAAAATPLPLEEGEVAPEVEEAATAGDGDGVEESKSGAGRKRDAELDLKHVGRGGSAPLASPTGSISLSSIEKGKSLPDFFPSEEDDEEAKLTKLASVATGAAKGRMIRLLKQQQSSRRMSTGSIGGFK